MCFFNLCYDIIIVNYSSKAVFNDSPDIKLFILVGPELFCLLFGPPGFNCWFLLLQCSSGVVRHPRDLPVSVASRFCRILIFVSS